MTEKELLIETIQYYHKDRTLRGYDYTNRHCCYITDSGEMCAVGRCMINPESIKPVNQREPIKDLSKGNIDELLKPQYHGIDIIFWQELQSLHDVGAYWSENGITASGIEKVKAIMNKSFITTPLVIDEQLTIQP